MRRHATWTVLALSALALPAAAYEPGTHREIGWRAVEVSGVDRVLKDQFSLLAGSNRLLRSNDGQTLTLREWVGFGSFNEDVPAYRAFNHFHNPLRPWPNAGLVIGMSSVYWQQDPNQGDGGVWSWPFARRRFHDFLVGTDQQERDAALADVGRALGEMAHLIQDATSPPHTRNDPHPVHDGYEAGTERLRVQQHGIFDGIVRLPAVKADPAIFTATGDNRAPARIARLIDADIYGGVTPAGNSTLLGNAEYTNGGYVSDDTIFRDFALPRETALGAPFFDPPQGTPGARRYYPKVADGDNVSHFVAEGSLRERMAFAGQTIDGYILNTQTYLAEARFLVPRAVGYSAALIDRFFEPEIDIAAPQQFIYSRAAFEDGNTGSFSKLTFRVRKSTPGPGGSGTLRAVVRYRRGLDNLIENPVAISNDLSYSVSAPRTASLGSGFTELTFEFPNAIPTNSADLYLTVVYRGPAGEEQDAVLYGSKDLFEPDPVDVGNMTDYDCFGPDPFQVSDFSAWPPFDFNNPDPETNPQPRDLSQPKDGFPELFGPQDELSDVYMKISSLQAPQFASPSVFDYTTPQRLARTAPEYVRFFVLQDQLNYLLSWRVGRLVERGFLPNSTLFNALLTVVPTANINHVIVLPNGAVVHEVSFPFTYRGLITQNLNILVNSIPRFNACFPNTVTLPPDFSKIDGSLPPDPQP
jgi:hypothetical protein